MKQHLILCALLSVFVGCNDDSDNNEPAIQLLVNTNMEAGATSPNNWWDMMQTVYSTEWTTQEASSGTKSLKISAEQSDPTNFAFWAQSYTGAIPVGKDIVLSVKVKCKNVIGKGISIAIRADNADTQNGNAEQFNTTQGSTTITGDFDWTTYHVRLSGIQNDIKLLTVYFLLLDNTMGTVYFDDASLTVQ
jgi:hypothetical protein